ncbi:hypothetical protein ACIA5G_39855 [Amycolatopsis sp. NPDC051758]|uniref:CBU_0592 family membrane protein n=1 Tax=Amycolatopsis sp. NPDC051758 TaxID=3363935 RepID=UPI0037955282
MTSAQILQLTGSILLLIAFLLAQSSSIATTSPSYLILNWVGSGLLAGGLALAMQIGVVLEVIWSAASLISLVRLLAPPCREAHRHQFSPQGTTNTERETPC